MALDLRETKNKTKAQGTNSTSGTTLTDSSQNFQNLGVVKGDEVFNETDGGSTVVTAVGTTTLTLAAAGTFGATGKLYRVRRKRISVTGTNTSATANKLVDTGATFVTDGVQVGFTVFNDTDSTFATVTAVDSETQLALTADIFTAGSKAYTVINSEGFFAEDWTDLRGMFTGTGFLKHEYGGLEFDLSTVTTDDFAVGTGAGAIGLKTAAQVRDILSLGTGDTVQFTALGMGAAATTNLLITESNTDTLPALHINQDSTGDAALKLTLGSTAGYAVGIDNSDGDKFKIAYAASGTPVLGTNDRLAIDNASVTMVGGATEPTYGSDLITNGDFATGDFTGWTAGANWAVVSNAAKHTAGNTATLDQSITVTSGTTYQIEWDDTGGSAGTYTFSIGAVTSRVYNYWEASTAKRTTIIASGSGAQTFSITPNSSYNGSIDNVTVRAVTAFASPVSIATHSDGTTAFEILSGGTGNNNSALGVSALQNNTTGYQNSALGVNALQNNTTGYYNSALGVNALQNNTTGYYNSAIGRNALLNNTTGYQNSALGVSALQNNTTGYNNSALGVNALLNNTTGYQNSAIGRSALQNNTTGYNNSALGRNALQNNTTGYNNSALGFEGGQYISGGSTPNQTSDTSVYLGVSTKALADGDTNEIVIGYNATGLGSNTAILGNSSIVTTQLQGNIVLGAQSALATTATDGFAYIPTMAGTPTGTPTSYTGKSPMVYDTTAHKIWVYSGSWRSVAVA